MSDVAWSRSPRGVAAVLLALRVPFLPMVVAAALTAALLRAVG